MERPPRSSSDSNLDRVLRSAKPDGVFWVIAGVIIVPMLVITEADPDLWGHVRFGFDILAGTWPGPVDPYSFTQDVPWINHEWLSEVQMALAYRLGGPAGLSLLKGLLVGAVLSLVLSAHRRRPLAVAGAVLVLVGAGTGRVLVTLRPQLWSLLAFTLLCLTLLRKPRRSWLLYLPLLFVCWANLHGGWVVGAGALAIWTVAQLIDPQGPRLLSCAIALLSALATLLNPYGWRLWQFLAATVRPARNISEWQPLSTALPLNWIAWAIVAAGMVWTVVRVRPLPRLERIGIVTLLAYGSFQVVRLLPFFVVAGVLLLSTAIPVQHEIRARRPPVLPTVKQRGIFALVAAGIVMLSAAVAATRGRCISMTGAWIADGAAGRALVAEKPQGKMVTWFDWGEYAIWHLSPTVRVSIDGRRETVYSDAVLNAHDQMNAATPDGIRYLQQLSPDYVWLPMEFGALREWLGANGYRIDLQTPRSFIAVRGDRPVLRPPGVPTVSACFPGP